MLKSLVKGFILNSLGLFLLKVTGLTLSIFVARQLGLHDLGLYSAAIASVILFGSSVANSLSMTTASFYSKNVNNENNAIDSYLFGNLYVMGYFCVLLLFYLFTKDSLFENQTVIFPLVALAVLFYAPVFGIMNAIERFSSFGSYSLFGFIVFLSLLTYYAINQKLTVDVALLLYAVPYVLIGVLLHFKVIEYIGGFNLILNRLKKLDFVYFYRYAKQNLMLSLSSATVPFAFWFSYNQIVIGENSTENIAVFASCMQWGFLFSQISVVLGGVLVSKLSENTSDNKSITALNKYSAWLPVSLMASVLIAFPEIHLFVFGNKFLLEIVAPTLTLVLITTVFNAMKSALQRSVVAQDVAWISVVSNSIWLIIFISSVLYIELSSIKEFALIYLISNFISFLIMLPIYLRFKLVSLSIYKQPTSLSLYFLIIMISLVSLFSVGGLIRIVSLICLNGFVIYMFCHVFYKRRIRGLE